MVLNWAIQHQLRPQHIGICTAITTGIAAALTRIYLQQQFKTCLGYKTYEMTPEVSLNPNCRNLFFGECPGRRGWWYWQIGEVFRGGRVGCNIFEYG